jgi:Zn-dependent protease with chaperone function
MAEARIQRWLVLLAALLALAIAADGLAFHVREAVADVAAGVAPSAAGTLMLALVAAEAVLISRALRRLRTQRRFLRSLRPCGETEVNGVPVVLLADARPLVFCAGIVRPRIYLSAGARERLGQRALHAVLAHEAHHARRRDPLRLLIASVFTRVPGVGALVRRHETLADLAADDAAVRALDGPGPLAAAMLALSDGGVAPERVDQLRGARLDLRPAAGWLAGALVVLAAALASTLQHLAGHLGA